MNSISINSEKYVKATDIARELGYTADYVGQLCRAKKVDAQLVGRSWYVSEDSIRHYKKNRYRSTKAFHKKIISTSLTTKDTDAQDTYPVHLSVAPQKKDAVNSSKKFYTRLPQTAVPTYFSDEADLIPTKSPIKTGRLKVELGDSLPVQIVSNSPEFDFKPEEREILKFQGALKVNAVYESDTEREDWDSEEKRQGSAKINDTKKIANHHNHTTKVKSDSGEKKQDISEKASKIKVKHLRKERRKSKKSLLLLENNTDGIISMTNGAPRVVGGTLNVPVISPTSKQSPTGFYFIYISFSTAILLVFFMIGMQVSVLADGVESSLSYTFAIDNLLAAVSFFR